MGMFYTIFSAILLTITAPFYIFSHNIQLHVVPCQAFQWPILINKWSPPSHVMNRVQPCNQSEQCPTACTLLNLPLNLSLHLATNNIITIHKIYHMVMHYLFLSFSDWSLLSMQECQNTFHKWPYLRLPKWTNSLVWDVNNVKLVLILSNILQHNCGCQYFHIILVHAFRKDDSNMADGIKRMIKPIKATGHVHMLEHKQNLKTSLLHTFP